MVSIPLPQIDWPRFRFGSKDRGGVGQGQGDVGDSLGKGDPNADGPGKAGDQAGDHALEVELSLEELAQIMGEELQLPRIEPKGKQRIIARRTSTSASGGPAPNRCATSSAPSGRRCGARS